MTKYIFLLGRNTHISIAELSAVLPKNTNFIHLQNDFLLLETEKINNIQEFLNRIGGTIKIIEITQEHQNTHIPKVISQLAYDKFKDREDKVRFAVTVHNLNGTDEKQMKNSLMETKKLLKKSNISCRFINNNFKTAPIALLLGENIINKGAEFNAININKNWYFGETVAIQDINEYSKRDFERPERDPKLGMLPPKLAQILINLAEVKIGQTIYDPFCGIGTILMESLLMGLNVIGSDLSADNIKKTESNLKWLKEQAPQLQNSIRLFQKDATQTQKKDLQEKISAIISETFLGPPISKYPTYSQIEQNQALVGGLIYNFLKNIYPLIPQQTKLVLTLLTYRTENGFHKLNKIHQALNTLGYNKIPIISGETIKNLKLNLKDSESLIYERPDQVVCREIIVLEKR